MHSPTVAHVFILMFESGVIFISTLVHMEADAHPARRYTRKHTLILHPATVEVVVMLGTPDIIQIR